MRRITLREEYKLRDKRHIIFGIKNWRYQRIDIRFGWEVPYIIIYNTDRPEEMRKNKSNHTRTLRLSLVSPEIIECVDNHFNNWYLDYDGMRNLIIFLKSNVRANYPSLPPLSVWDYINYQYHKETGLDYLPMPDYQLLSPKSSDEDNGYYYYEAFSSELNEFRLDDDDAFTIVENKMHIHNVTSLFEDEDADKTHFIISDGNPIYRSTKAARISFIEPKYLHCSDVNTEEWILSKEEINIMIDYFSKDNYRMWNNVLECRDEYSAINTLKFSPLIKIPMPDYTKLLKEV